MNRGHTPRYVEELLIEAFGVPVLNGVVKGYGSQAQGSKRATQRTCEFNILFPGRRGCTGAANVTADELRNRVIIHLAQTVPDVCTTGVGPSHVTVLISAQSHLRDGCALIDTSELSGTMC